MENIFPNSRCLGPSVAALHHDCKWKDKAVQVRALLSGPLRFLLQGGASVQEWARVISPSKYWRLAANTVAFCLIPQCWTINYWYTFLFTFFENVICFFFYLHEHGRYTLCDAVALWDTWQKNNNNDRYSKYYGTNQFTFQPWIPVFLSSSIIINSHFYSLYQNKRWLFLLMKLKWKIPRMKTGKRDN